MEQFPRSCFATGLQRIRMNRENFIILIIGLLLLAGMVLTIFFGGEKSRHGVGSLRSILPVMESAFPA
jgi:preprotein translocase subunit SecY